VDCNPKYNPWNLPDKARVLLITNLPACISKPMEIFHLFSNYGDVARVKICRNENKTALVEFFEAKYAYIARNGLDQYKIGAVPIYVTFSKYDRIRLPSETPKILEKLAKDEEYKRNTMDFTSKAYEDYRYRFKSEQHITKNLPRVGNKPSRTIKIVNIPSHVTADHIKNYLVYNCEISVFDIIAVRRKHGKCDPVEGPEFDRHMVVNVEFDSCVAAMAKLCGLYASWKDDGSPGAYIGLMCYFDQGSDKTVARVREKIGKGRTEFMVIPNDQVIPPYP